MADAKPWKGFTSTQLKKEYEMWVKARKVAIRSAPGAKLAAERYNREHGLDKGDPGYHPPPPDFSYELTEDQFAKEKYGKDKEALDAEKQKEREDSKSKKDDLDGTDKDGSKGGGPGGGSGPGGGGGSGPGGAGGGAGGGGWWNPGTYTGGGLGPPVYGSGGGGLPTGGLPLPGDGIGGLPPEEINGSTGGDNVGYGSGYGTGTSTGATSGTGANGTGANGGPSGQLTAEQQAAYEQALANNDARYEDILRGYQQRQLNSRDMLNELAVQERADVDRRYDRQFAASEQDLIDRGLGNSTVRNSIKRGVEESRNSSQGQISDRLNQQQLALYTGMSGDQLAYMERRTDAYPDLALFAQLQQQYGASGADGGLGGTAGDGTDSQQQGQLGDKRTADAAIAAQQQGSNPGVRTQADGTVAHGISPNIPGTYTGTHQVYGGTNPSSPTPPASASSAQGASPSLPNIPAYDPVFPGVKDPAKVRAEREAAAAAAAQAQNSAAGQVKRATGGLVPGSGIGGRAGMEVMMSQLPKYGQNNGPSGPGAYTPGWGGGAAQNQPGGGAIPSGGPIYATTQPIHPSQHPQSSPTSGFAPPTAEQRRQAIIYRKNNPGTAVNF